MNITIGSFKFRVEILILIGVVLFILFGNVLCSCSKISFREGLEMAKQVVSKNNKITASKAVIPTNNWGPVNKKKEGFVGFNNLSSETSFSKTNSPDYIMDPSSWSMPSLSFSPGTTPDAGVESIWNREKQQIPLPEGELDMFAKTPFKPECCPNTYSSSTGCACMTVNQYNYLQERGGNNIPYSEY